MKNPITKKNLIFIIAIIIYILLIVINPILPPILQLFLMPPLILAQFILGTIISIFHLQSWIYGDSQVTRIWLNVCTVFGVFIVFLITFFISRIKSKRSLIIALITFFSLWILAAYYINSMFTSSS